MKQTNKTVPSPQVNQITYIDFSDLEKWLKSKIDFKPFDELDMEWFTPHGNDHFIKYRGELNISSEDREKYPVLTEIESLIYKEFKELIDTNSFCIFISW
ncbi:hypothetical protein H6775_03855 [Candidatus Nomurabacteria bacterium]|nr:hypothetical protein [Candidatus Nomurabacteria bacterium]